jgi:hypothetical protein
VSQGIALAEIANFTKRLQVLYQGFASTAPWFDVIDVQRNARLQRRAGAAGTATKIIALQHVEP